jgi:DNA ligase-associated metallophosphoesterase
VYCVSIEFFILALLTKGVYSLSFQDQTLLLLPQKAIFWQQEGILLIADVHLGKINHFRKAGIAVPHIATTSDYTVLEELLQEYPVKEVLFLGDLFHSESSKACREFTDWLVKFPHIHFALIKGNHDILPAAFYIAANITVYTDTFIRPPFVLSHIPLTQKSVYYNLSGHLHPAVQLFGRGRQVLTLPCYYFGETNGILPAFGSFTGKAIINPEPGSKVFAIADNMVSYLK